MGHWPEHVEPFGRIGDHKVVDRITEAAARRSRHVYDDERHVEPPNVAQVGMVLRALADHSLMLQAVTWARDESWRDEPSRVSTSVGRWMHAAANACEDEWWRQHEPHD